MPLSYHCSDSVRLAVTNSCMFTSCISVRKTHLGRTQGFMDWISDPRYLATGVLQPCWGVRSVTEIPFNIVRQILTREQECGLGHEDPQLTHSRLSNWLKQYAVGNLVDTEDWAEDFIFRWWKYTYNCTFCTVNNLQLLKFFRWDFPEYPQGLRYTWHLKKPSSEIYAIAQRIQALCNPFIDEDNKPLVTEWVLECEVKKITQEI